jgi:hypothetical protein
LCASGWIDFVALRAIPAIMHTAIRTKFTIIEKYETNLRLIFYLMVENFIINVDRIKFFQCLFFITLYINSSHPKDSSPPSSPKTLKA